MSIASCTSPRVSARTLPISRVMSFENSSLRWSNSSAARNKISARFGAGTSRHVLYASFAASTAASTSSSVEDTNIPINSPVFAGLRFSYALPLRDSTHSPLMKFLNSRGATAVAILPPQSLKLATLLFVWSNAGWNAKHSQVESEFYSCLSIRSNAVPLSCISANLDPFSEESSPHPGEFCQLDTGSSFYFYPRHTRGAQTSSQTTTTLVNTRPHGMKLENVSIGPEWHALFELSRPAHPALI